MLNDTTFCITTANMARLGLWKSPGEERSCAGFSLPVMRFERSSLWMQFITVSLSLQYRYY